MLAPGSVQLVGTEEGAVYSRTLCSHLGKTLCGKLAVCGSIVFSRDANQKGNTELLAHHMDTISSVV